MYFTVVDNWICTIAHVWNTQNLRKPWGQVTTFFLVRDVTYVTSLTGEKMLSLSPLSNIKERLKANKVHLSDEALYFGYKSDIST